jgi:hypothetical protein
MRGRNRNNKGPNPLTRSYESNGPDVKIRGTAQHIAEKYSQLARDAQSSGDPVAAENYLQHAEHYFRIIAAAQEQLREQYGYQRSFDEDGEEEGGFAPASAATPMARTAISASSRSPSRRGPSRTARITGVTIAATAGVTTSAATVRIAASGPSASIGQIVRPRRPPEPVQPRPSGSRAG